MEYLQKGRPPVPPTRLEAIQYFLPGKSIWIDIEGVVRVASTDFISPHSNGVEQNFIEPELPPDEEIDRILDLMLEEWKVEEKRMELRSKLPNLLESIWNLWKDIDADIIPGKSGSFYTSIKDVIDKYSEGEDSILYPYDNYK